MEHVFNIILGKETGTTFPVSVQDKGVNALLDTGAEKRCMSMDMFAGLKLPLNVAKIPKLRNASGKDMKMHGVTTVKFRVGNTIFTQEFVVCDNLVRPIIIGRDFTVNNFIGIAWTRQGTKVTKDDKLVIEIEEPMRKKTLTMTRKVTIPPRNFAVFDIKCEEWKGKYEIKLNPFLRKKEPNLWMDKFMLYNVPEKEDHVDAKEEVRTQDQENTKDSEYKDPSEGCVHGKEESKKVHLPYCIFNLSHEHHSYILKGSVVAFADPEDGEENKVFEVEEICGKEEYRNWVPKKKGFLPIPSKSDFLCSPAEVSAHRKVKLKSKPISEDTEQKFEELCECFPEVFSKNSEDIRRMNLITMNIDTGDHPPICQKPYTLALKHYEWVQKEVEQLERMGIITRSVSPGASPIVIVPKKSAPDEPPRRHMCINF